MKKLMTLVLSTMIVALLVACGSPAAAPAAKPAENVQYLKFAVQTPLTGSMADWGEAANTAAKYFADYINGKGGFEVKGVKTLIQADISDSTSDSTQSPTLLEGILSKDKYAAVVGNCTSALALADVPIAEQHKVPLFWNGTSNALVGKGREFAFRVTPGGPQFTAAQVGLLSNMRTQYGLNLTKIAVFYENTSWGVSQSADSKKNIEAAGGFELVVNEKYEPKMTDATALITKAMNAGAEIVFVMAQPADCKLILNTMTTMKYEPLIIGGGGSFLFPSLAKELGDKVQGVLTVAGTNWSNKFLNSDAELVDFVKGYEKQYGHFLNDHGVQVIVQMATVIEAAQKTGSLLGEDIGKALHSETFSNKYTKMIQPGTPIKFNADGDVLPYALMVQWQNKQPVCVYPLEAASGTLIVPKNIQK